ncbi:MAG: hypothetical protein ACLFVU_01535 [Phycisphaerae bacterium]
MRIVASGWAQVNLVGRLDRKSRHAVETTPPGEEMSLAKGIGGAYIRRSR